MGASKPASFPERHSIIASPPANPLSDKGVRSGDRSSGPWRPLAPAQGWPVMPWLVLEAAASATNPPPDAAAEKITHLCFFAPQPKLPVGPREGEGLIAGV